MKWNSVQPIKILNMFEISCRNIYIYIFISFKLKYCYCFQHLIINIRGQIWVHYMGNIKTIFAGYIQLVKLNKKMHSKGLPPRVFYGEIVAPNYNIA